MRNLGGGVQKNCKGTKALALNSESQTSVIAKQSQEELLSTTGIFHQIKTI